MKPGLYRVKTEHFCAGFVIDRDHRLAACAPILRRRFKYWSQFAVRVGDLPGWGIE